MKALQIQADRRGVLIDVSIPEPGPGEVRVRVDAVTICTQWDLHLKHNSPMFPGHHFHYPYTIGQPGHEASGVIDALGANVSEFALGDRVSVWRDPGHHLMGAYAEFMVRPTEEVIRVPSHLPAWSTAPVELAMCVACTVMMLRSMAAIRGQRVAVSGLGPAGLIAVQMLKAEGAARVVGIDPLVDRRHAACQVGADTVWSPEEAATFLPLRENPAIDTSIDCVGSRASAGLLMDRTRDTVALFGVQREDYPFAFRHFIGLRLCGYPPHHRGAAEYAVALMEAGQLDLAPLVSHQLRLEDYDAAIELLESHTATKVCLRP